MRKVLLPVDGSDSAFQATLYVIDFVQKHGPLEVHVVNVQPKPLEWQTRGTDKEVINDHQAIEAHMVMKPILHALNEEEIAHQTHIKLGDPAEVLAALADELGCDHIVMGTRGLGAISGIVLGSVTRKLLHLTRIPVICIKHPA
ncbi:MAG: universal stress protein [Betaproteobacteria bacterium]|nr:universal stress protein [Betaproteobacteria bacterium]